jgi:hypothetical protein
MSASDVYTEWHLTPRGWKVGTEKYDGWIKLRRRPADAVLTCRNRQVVSWMLSRAHRSRATLRRSTDSARVRALLERFGPCPRHL